MGVYRKLKSDGSWDWYIDYRFQGRRLRERIGPNKAQARTVLQKRRVEMAEGKFLEKRRESKTTLAEMAKLYLDNHAKPAKRSWKDDKRLLDGFVEYFGDIRLSEITPLTLENYRRDKKTPDKKGKKLADATLNRHMAALKTMFSKAVEWGKAASNPVKTIKLYHENNARTRFLERGEIKALLAACPDWLKPIVVAAVHTGLRKAEIVSLTWDDIDFQNMILRVRDSKNKSARHVPMSLPLVGTLRAINKAPDSPYVFACESRALLYGRIRYAFQEAVATAQLSGKVVFHSLRHSFASHMVMNGVDLPTVGSLMGHKTAKMTERYSHLSPDHKARAIKVLDSLVANEVDTLMPPEPPTSPTQEAEAYAKNVANARQKSILLPGGEMVSQRTLNPLFLVRIQAWEGAP